MKKKIEGLMHCAIHILEVLIATLTILVLVAMLILEIYRMFTVPDYLASADVYLHNTLTIVVGLEFVRMLINMTPSNTLEVLIVAISRQVILSHNDPISNIVCVVCIAGLFAVRRFLVPKGDMKVEFSEAE
ncbi:MAG: hypothetical protein J6C39_04455 [Clostridia bacterium]|nr:hypothetical protein [Clostridia bacterium]